MLFIKSGQQIALWAQSEDILDTLIQFRQLLRLAVRLSNFEKLCNTM